MSSLFSTISTLPSHLIVEMSIALCIGMKTVMVVFGTSIDSFGRELASPLVGESIGEGTQHNCSGRLHNLTQPRVSNLCLSWRIICRKHDAKRSIGSRFDLNLT